MYDLVFNFLLDNIFNSSDLATTSSTILGLSMNANEWLAHTTTIVVLCLIVAVFVFFTKWLFRLVGGLFLLK